VRHQNEEIQERKVNEIIKKRNEKEKKMESLQHQKEEERIYKHNIDALKRLDKEDNVKRNENKKEYERQLLLMKQALIDEKINAIKKEKQDVRAGKAEIKKRIEIEKADLAEKFKLVQTGKADPSILKGLTNNTHQYNSLTGSPKPKKRKAESPQKEADDGGYQKPFPNRENFETREQEASRLQHLPPDKR